jgi:hypothetical protein
MQRNDDLLLALRRSSAPSCGRLFRSSIFSLWCCRQLVCMNVAREVAAPWADHFFLIEKLKTFCHAFSKQHGVDDAFVRWKPTSSGPQCHFCLIFFR